MNQYAWVSRSLLMLAVGAVLAYAVSYRSAQFNVPVAGLCLIAVGLFDLFLGLCLAMYRRDLADEPRPARPVPPGQPLTPAVADRVPRGPDPAPSERATQPLRDQRRGY
jgi:hypothetical protein